jgi:hypothetical protein
MAGMVLDIRPADNYLHVVVSGEFSLTEAQRAFLQILESVSRLEADKVLVDGRKLTGDPKTLERFDYAEFTTRALAAFAERGVSRATQFAYVLAEPVRDPGRFGETVALNRGLRVRTFSLLDDALGWLGAGRA